MNKDCSAAASSPINLQTNHAPRVTPPIAHAACRIPDHTWNVDFTTVTRTINPGHALPTHSLGDEPPAVAASGATSALCKNSSQRSRKSKFKQNRKPATQNPGPPSKPQYDKKTQPIPLYKPPLLIGLQPQRLELFSLHGRRAIKHAGHRLPGALRLLRPFPGHLDDNFVVTTDRQSRQDSAALHGRRLRSGGGFARTTLAPE